MSRPSRYFYCCAVAVLILLLVTTQRQLRYLSDGGSEEWFASRPPSPVTAEKDENENEVREEFMDGEDNYREDLPIEERYPEAHSRIEARMSYIREVCERTKHKSSKSYNMYYFKKFGVTWLPVFKSSSTTWKIFFIDEILGPDAEYKGNHASYRLLFPSGLNAKKELKPASKTGPRKRQWAVEPDSSIRFTIIRHPLSRLVSFYRHSLIGANLDEWIIPAVVHARKKASWTAAQERKYRDELETSATARLKPDPNTTNPYLPLPTFPEFIEFILYARAHQDRRGFNEHWRPSSARIDVCYNDLDIITKLENEQDELPYLLGKLNMTQYTDKLLKTKANPSGVSTVEGELVLGYLKQLSIAQQMDLNSIYTFDYEIFKYEPIFTFHESEP